MLVAINVIVDGRNGNSSIIFPHGAQSVGMRSSVLAVALSALLSAFGGQKPNSAPANSLHNCTIAGTVTDAENGQPLAAAEIGLSLEGTSSANLGGITDDGGRFEIKDIPPGEYEIWASDPGYLSMQYGQRKFNSPGQTLRLSAGQNTTGIAFRLSREAAITGHVYDENGRPVEQASAQALGLRWAGGKRALQTIGSTSTDDRGEFSLYGLAPGQYCVLALYGGPPPAKNTAYSPTYYPGVLDSSTASPITLTTGEELPGVDFSLQTVGAFHVRGRVTSIASDLPLAHVNVRLAPSGGVKWGYYASEAKVTDAQGDFDIPTVPPGSYNLSAGLGDDGIQYQAWQAIQVSDSDVNGAVLVLSPPVTLSGRVRAEGSVNLSRVRVFLREGNSPYYAIRWPAGVTVKSDGTFTIKDVFGGTYTVEVWGFPPNGYLKRATLAGQDVLESGLCGVLLQVPAHDAGSLPSTAPDACRVPAGSLHPDGGGKPAHRFSGPAF